ncbi:FAD binding domain protein [Apiospora phragmitis]|uniref:FAD binding domain protein n=1 Tax=Apiospora phragmitis TaxID=2905665 RepID=A0ABR1VXM0_9PEZI
MHLPSSFSASLCSLAVAQPGAFEPADFNVTEALRELAIYVEEIPSLESFREGPPMGRQGADDEGQACQAAASLQSVYGGGAVYTQGEAGYSNFTGSYWSDAQQHVSPSCIFKPSRVSDVSAVVLLSRLTQCPCAAKSGGRRCSIEAGITISFANLNGISLNSDKIIASIGPGNVWGHIYEALVKSDLTVIGGRLFNIGVGGLTTGGGISYFSPRYGWACDNVESFDVVTASGMMVRASAQQFPDLYSALRGGSNNFGLVVNFHLRTLPLPRAGSGAEDVHGPQLRGLDEAFAYAAANAAQDVDAGLYLVYLHAKGKNLGLPVLIHADAVHGAASPVWAGFDNITAAGDTTKTRVLVEWTAETMHDSPDGRRQLFYTLSTKADVDLATFARARFFATVADIADVPGIGPNLMYQAIGMPQLEQMRKDGGNALVLEDAAAAVSEGGGPVYIMLLAASWAHAEDNGRTLRHGLFAGYVYMNYASEYQDVVGSYGGANKARLKRIAAKYDPAQVFQRLQPGYFKLDRAPTPGTAYYNI